MRICFLTQTAHDISDYYKSFFCDKDLFFITFKTQNERAVDFLPNSTWSDGRNRLWEIVKDKYDYYVFIDDDLRFLNFESKFSFSALAAYTYHKLYKKNFVSAYEYSSSTYFISKLTKYLCHYLPEVMAVTQLESIPTARLDTAAMRKNSFVRRLGYFDAQFTVFSNYAAHKILPYDTNLSGWWSSQLPVYLYSFHVFASKAINISELAVTNNFHTGAYVENYDGIIDCKKMITEISKATGRDYSALGSNDPSRAVNFLYGERVIIDSIPKAKYKEDYAKNYSSNLDGIEKLLHLSMKV